MNILTENFVHIQLRVNTHKVKKMTIENYEAFIRHIITIFTYLALISHYSFTLIVDIDSKHMPL